MTGPGTVRSATRIVYTPESQMKTPWTLAVSIWRDIWGSRELSWRLFSRDLSAQYRQSILGAFWAFVTPLVTSLIFIVLQSRNVVNLGEVGIPYPVYVVVGTIVWQVFVESVNAPLKAVTAAKPMLSKINFPREALIVAALYMVLYGLVIKLTVLAGVLLLFGTPLTPTALLALAPMLMLVLFGMCVGLLLTPTGMLYTDVAAALPVVTQLLFFVTPVVYMPPKTFPFSLIAVLNPVSPLLMAARDLMTRGSVSNPELLALVSVATVVGMGVALVVYRISVPIFIERTSA